MCVYKIEEIAERVRPVAEQYKLSKVYLFGSYARGEATEESDVDLLVGAENVHGFAFGGLYNDLQEALGKELDLITLRGLYSEYRTDWLSVRLRNAIERDRRLIYDEQG
ncbi:MAG: nucleotidyltransferase domain-containing protein [Oscillospiraceae bacterium]|nr:nucleotidyltransferase domain-containing protein [Oscillospiraceae bacterium]